MHCAAAAGAGAGGLRRRGSRHQVPETRPPAGHRRGLQLMNNPKLAPILLSLQHHQRTWRYLNSPPPLIISGLFFHMLLRIKLPLLLPVVLPPLPGEDGEIYDDVLDPSLEVRWVFQTQPPVKAGPRMRVCSRLVGSPVTRTLGSLLQSPAASCECLSGADARSAIKRKPNSPDPFFFLTPRPTALTNPEPLTESRRSSDLRSAPAITSGFTNLQ